MNTLRLSFVLDSGGTATLRPVIDGLDLLTGYTNDRGLDPERLLPPLSSLLLPTRTGRRVLIGCCSCGETGCGSLSLRVRRRGDEVVWEPDEEGPGESISRSYRFGLQQYLDAVDDAAEDRPGEGRGSRVARQVRLALGLHDHADDSLTTFAATRVDWISARSWDSEAFSVSLSGAAGQQIEEFSALPRESDRAVTARVVARVNDLRYHHEEEGDQVDSPDAGQR